MKRNLKNLILFILTIVTVVFVVSASLAASKPVIQIEEKGISIPLDPIINENWDGLGMVTFFAALNADEDRDVLLANFEEFRWLLDYSNAAWIASSHTTIINSVALGTRIIYGVTAGAGITRANWSTFTDAVKAEALWSQNHGVYEFQIGNELEYWTGYQCATGKLTRLNNVVTVETPVAHGFDGLHQVTIFPMYYDVSINPSNMAGTFDINVIDATHFSYTAAGANGSNISDVRVTDLPVASLITNLKSLATEVQAIFTNGNVTYTPAYPWFSDWIAAGKGGIDKIGGNIYQDNEWYKEGDFFSNYWKDEIDDLIAAFGTDGMYISEFNLSAADIDNYSADETVQAGAVADMIDYIRSQGVTRADFYCWKDYVGEGNFGVTKTDGTYRELWNVLTGTDTTLQVLQYPQYQKTLAL